MAFVFRSARDTKVVTNALPTAAVYQTPVHAVDATAAPTGPTLAFSYADILYRCGYRSADELRHLVTQWHAIFEELGPCLVVCDHSPTALIAAAGRVPSVHLGSGFASPPPGRPFVPLCRESEAGASEREAAVLRSLQEVGSEFALPEFRHPSDIFRLGATFACCLPELDPYRAVRDAPAIGPMHPLPKPVAELRREFVFGYLAGDDQRVPSLLRRLAQAKIACSLFVRDMPANWEDEFAGTSLRFFDAPQDLPTVMGAASAVLHHGGVATSETALAIGRPQFVLPRYLEQSITANQLERLGCGVNLLRHKVDPAGLIRTALRHESLQHAAQVRADELHRRPSIDTAQTILDRCLALVQ